MHVAYCIVVIHVHTILCDLFLLLLLTKLLVFHMAHNHHHFRIFMHTHLKLGQFYFLGS